MNPISKKIEATLLKSKKYIDTSLSNKYIVPNKFKESRMTESKEVDISDMLSFLTQNKNYVNKFPLKDTYTQAVAEKFRDEFDIYLSSDNFEIASIKFKASSVWITYDQLVKEYKEFSAKSGISSEDQKVKQAFEYLLRYARFDGKMTLSNFDKIYLSQIFSFLLYIKNGKMPEQGVKGTGGDIEAEVKENTDYDYWGNKAFRSFKSKYLPGYTMSLLKNGKFIVKGLSSNDIEKIKHVFRLFGRDY